jgi:hypothetical protein
MTIEKKCPSCDRVLPASSFHRDKSTSSGLRCWCKECCSWKFKKQFLGTDAYNQRLRKYEENRKIQRALDPRKPWVTNALNNAKRRAVEQGVDFSLTREDLLDLLEERCPLLGCQFAFAKGKTVPESPSVDRKDSSKGYTKENVWVISAKANRIKSNATTDEIEAVLLGLRKAGV